MKIAAAVFVILWAAPIASAKEGKQTIEVVEHTKMVTVLPSGGLSVSFGAKAVLSDGSHAELFCMDNDKNCGAIELTAPEKMPPGEPECKTVGSQTLCTSTKLGTFSAMRKNNVLTLKTLRGKRSFRIVGSW